MSATEKTGIEKGTHVVVPKWWGLLIGVISPITVISFFINFGIYKNDIENRVFETIENRVNTHSHISDKTKHMSLMDKDLRYMTRKELDVKFELVTSQLLSISEKLDIVINR